MHVRPVLEENNLNTETLNAQRFAEKRSEKRLA